MSGDNATYSSETYPGSSQGVDDTVSSAANLYGSKDVTWSWNSNGGGTDFCVNPNTSVLWVGLYNNDQFTSHVVHANNSAC